MKRRTFLQASAVISVIVGAGGVWRAQQQGVFSVGQGPAYEPWHTWRSDSEKGPLALVRAAILAANPHNTQPWRFKVGAQRIELYADTERNLGSFDPYLREMHLGLGCALENMLLAAAANGYQARLKLSEGHLEPIPESPVPRLVASLDLSPAAAQRSALYEAIGSRHTQRGAYLPQQAVSAENLASLHQLLDNDPDLRLFTYSDSLAKAAFARAVVEATQAIIADTAMVNDSEKWFRHDWNEIQTLRDGPTLDCAGLSPLVTALGKMIPPPSAQTNHQYWLESTRDVQVASAPAFALLAVRDRYSRAQSLRAGRAWQRLQLWATSQGIAMQPLNQPIERIDRERQLNLPPQASKTLTDLTGDPSWQPTFAFRLGYAVTPTPASPRRSLEQVVEQS